MQDQGQPQRRVAPDVQGRQHHSTVAFPADERMLVPNGAGYVSFADRRADQARPAGSRGIFHYQTGRQVRHDRGCLRVTGASVQHRSHGKGEGIVLADRPAGLIHDGQSVDIRIDRESNRGAALAHQAPELTEVLRNWLRRPRELSVRLQIDPAHPASQPLQHRRDGRGAGPSDAIDCNMELPCTDRGDADHRERQDRLEVPLHRRRVLSHLAEAVPAHSRRPLLGQRPYPLARLGVQENPVRADELERVPFDRVMTRRQDQTRAGVMMFHRHLHGRGRHHAEVDHIHADRHQAGRRGSREHRPAGPAVPAEHHGGTPAQPVRAGDLSLRGRAHPGAQRRRVPRHQLGREVGAHVPPHAGDADHERVGYRHGRGLGCQREIGRAERSLNARRNASTTGG
jgi:hypothetical protein